VLHVSPHLATDHVPDAKGHIDAGLHQQGHLQPTLVGPQPLHTHPAAEVTHHAALQVKGGTRHTQV
jgi:hypothetical protein